MAINFPNSPTVGDTFTAADKTWIWNGTAWVTQSSGGGGGGGGTPDAHASTHGVSGSDPVTIAESQVTNLTTDLAAKATNTALASHESDTTNIHGIANTANLVLTDDSRLSNSRTPTSHASTHTAGGADAITVAQSQVTGLSTALSGKQDADADLTAIASLAGTSGYLQKTAANTWSLETNVNADQLDSHDSTYFATATGLSTHTSATTSVHGISNTANLVYTSDSRLSDSRTPTAHALTHASGGTDAITVAQSQVTNLTTDLSAKAPLASPTFTGTPAAPTATSGTNTTQIATTEFVTTAVSSVGAKGGGTNQVFFENDATVTNDYTITTNKNAITAGPVTINSGVTVTIPNGSVWVIV
jgi:hypothetical protein